MLYLHLWKFFNIFSLFFFTMSKKLTQNNILSFLKVHTFSFFTIFPPYIISDSEIVKKHRWVCGYQSILRSKMTIRITQSELENTKYIFQIITKLYGKFVYSLSNPINF